MLPDNPSELKSIIRHFSDDPSSVNEAAYVELLKLAKTSNQVLRENVLRLLGRIGRQEAYDILVSQLKERYRHFRAAAAFGLGELGDPRAISFLEPLLKDSALAVRQEAEEAINKLRNKL